MKRVTFVCSVKPMHPIVVPSFHRRDDTLIGSIQSISLPQPCGLGLEAQSGITGSFKEAYIMTTLQRVGFYDLLKKCKYFLLQKTWESQYFI